MSKLDSSKEFEEILKKHSHYDRLGVETVELPLATLTALVKQAEAAARRDEARRIIRGELTTEEREDLERLKGVSNERLG